MREIGVAVRRVTLDLAERLADLDEAQWEAPSLCEEWRVRDVLAHTAAGAQGAYGFGAVISGLVRYRFDYNRWIAADGQARGQREPAVMLQELRDTAAVADGLSGTPAVRALAHVVIHGQDICRPLQIERELPGSYLGVVADFAASSVIFRAKKRIAGLRLVATDVDWSTGQGPEVSGPAEALVMMLAGRLAALDDLSGEGLSALHRSK